MDFGTEPRQGKGVVYACRTDFGDDFMYIEGLGSASVANGVLRIETFHRNGRGEDVNGADLIIPANRVTAVVTVLQGVIDQLRQQESALPGAANTPP